jgi:hypothetical protein
VIGKRSLDTNLMAMHVGMRATAGGVVTRVVGVGAWILTPERKGCGHRSHRPPGSNDY